jgi:anti-sigma-K factor RskA
MNCEEIEELLGVYALGALAPEEDAAVRDHLVSCENHPEAAELQAIAASLAFAVPEREPPAALKSRLMDEVRREGASPVAARRATGWLQRLVQPRLAPYALAAALAVAVVALLATNTGDGNGTVVTRFADGGQLSGQVVYIPDEDLAVIQVNGLEQLSEDETYQVWAMSEGQPRPIGFLEVSSEGHALTALGVNLADADEVAVTVEPRGGSPLPTTAPVLRARL